MGLEPGRFYFLFSFDYFSSPYRKNPLAVLEAFERAFPDGKENVGITLHSNGLVDRYSYIQKDIREASASDPRINVSERSLSHHDMLSLIRASDAYVSLHRSEGFGMAMAEAMAFGRIVIGTNFSGNTDFLTEQTGFPVPYTIRGVEAHEYHWADAQVWAEPDLHAAASILRQVYDTPEHAKMRADSGRKLIQHKYGAAQVGRAMKERLVNAGCSDRVCRD